VLVLHAWWGLNDFIRELANRLAVAGFTAFAPDLYRGATASTRDEAEKLASGLDQDAAQRDIAASAAGLRARAGVSGPRLGIIGLSLGAFLGLGFTQERPSDLSAVVVFYGTREGRYAETKAAFLAHFAESDEFESDSSIRDFEKAVRAAGRELTLHRYPGTTHWFFEADRPDAYNAAAADLAWRRTVEFLTRHLKGPES